MADIFCFGGGDNTSRIGRVRDASGRHSTWADGRCRRRHHCHGCVYCIFGPPSKHTDKRTVFFLLEPLHVFAGGSAAAAGELVEKQGGTVLKYLFVAEATSLGGAAKLGAPVYSIAKFDD